MSIGFLAAESGVKVTTVRYYERAGLIPPPARTAGRHRNYTSNHLQRLRLICRARELKFSIQEIKTLLVLADPARSSCCEVQHLAAAHLNKLRQEISVLMKLEAMLADAVAQCSGGPNLPCPVLDLLLGSRPVSSLARV
jgi:MerR family transcriptional regulator, mercuric resistance operon regulatory protein